MPWQFAGCFVLLLALAIGLQVWSGTYQSEIGNLPDEPSHVVTSLMIHDYLRDALGSAPMPYAENYYLHYPKAAFGMWPPVFHTLTAMWIMVFGRTEVSLLSFIALQTALLGTVLVFFASRMLPFGVSLGLGAGLLLLPLVQSSSTVVMLDILISLFGMLAMMLMVGYIEKGGRSYAIGFALMTALAMLTKGNSNSLVLVFLLLMLFTKKWEVLRDPWLYVAGGIIACLGGPWQIFLLKLYDGTMPLAKVNFAYVLHMFSGYGKILFDGVGAVAFVLAGVGFFWGWWSLARKSKSTFSGADYALAGAMALFAGFYGFHCTSPTPGPDTRYIVPALAPMLVLAAYGVARLAGWVSRWGLRSSLVAAGLAGLALLNFGIYNFYVPRYEAKGIREVARELQQARNPGQAVLVVSDASGEGSFISYLALHDEKAQMFVLRGSKMLSENPWFAKNYRPYYKSPAELKGFLDSVPVDAVIVDQTQAIWKADRELMLRTMGEYGGEWTKSGETGSLGKSRSFVLFQRREPIPPGKKNLKVPMKITLGRDLKL